MEPEPLQIRVVGELTLRRGGRGLALPPSKKTRALLAYLVLTGREHRRERLCDLFWDVADDPRGALRWSLSRLRPLLDEPGRPRVVANRESVRVEREGAHVDLIEVRKALGGGVDGAGTDELERAAELLRGEPLEGLDLPDFAEYQAWCVAEREEVRVLRARVLRALVDRLRGAPERALPHARALCLVEALDEGAAATLVEVLGALGRRAEAEEHHRSALKRLRELGAQPRGVLQVAWDRVRFAPPSPEPAAPVAAKAPPAALPPALSGRAHALPLVGREKEMRVLSSLLDASQASLHSLLVTGEPGAGKSRLLVELSEAVQRRGGTVLHAVAHEVERGRPYGPWIDASRQLPSGEALAFLFDERSSAEAEPTRERLFAGVAELLAASALAAPPVLLAFDDVQWLDAASATLLHYVVRSCRERSVLVVLAARAGELPDNARVVELVRGLRREQPFEELRLGPLDEQAVAALVREVRPGADGARVFAQSSGNALYALELARAGADGGPDASLSDLIRDRLSGLSPEARDLLDWACVLGRGSRAETLERLDDRSFESTMSGLAALERHGFLVEVCEAGEPTGEYAFVHDVVRQVVHGDISGPRRRLMHRRVASILQAETAGDDARAAEVAHHAELAGDHRLAVREHIRAARRCVRLFASAEAEGLVRRGLAATERLQEPERTERALELLELRHRARRVDTVDLQVTGIEELARRAVGQGSMDHAQRGLHVASQILWEHGRWTDAHDAALEAEAVTRAGDDAVRARAIAEAARCLTMLERDLPRAEELALEAAEIASRLGAEPVGVPATLGMLRLHEGRLDEAVELLERARARARAAEDGLAEAHALEQLVLAELSRGATKQAASLARELTAIGERLREGSELPFALALAALCDWACRAGGPSEELDRAIERLASADAKHRLAFVSTRAALLALSCGEPERARAHAERALANAERAGRPSEIALARAALLRAARALSDAKAVEEQTEALRATDRAGLSAEARAALTALSETDT